MEQPNYGIDALPVVRNLGLIGGLLIALSLFSFTVGQDTFVYNFRFTLLAPGITLLATAGLMVLYAKRGKFRHRDRMLAKINWRGDEKVLDVGTGAGLLLIGAAKKLTAGGRGIGIDIWNEEDLSDNSAETTELNARLEGVADKVEIKNEDARELTFPDAAFDVVLSNLCLHNIPNEQGRRKACAEIARVLKPGGIAVVSDFKNTAIYLDEFKKAGLKAERSGMFLTDTFPPLRMVTAKLSA
jgi:arsenite methyltransferase